MIYKVYSEETEVVPLLTRMKLPRHALLEIISKVAGERANTNDADPPSAVGYETWRWCVRYSREDQTLRANKWTTCEQDQISGIRNEELAIKLAFLGTDSNTGKQNRSPKNLNERGPASCRLIDANDSQTSFAFVKPDKPKFDLWYLCTYFCDGYISAEVSRPHSQIGGIVSSFSERIILTQPFEIPGIRRLPKILEEFADVPIPKIRRKP